MHAARACRQGRALPVAGGGAAGGRATQAAHQPAAAQHLEDVIRVPAPFTPYASVYWLLFTLLHLSACANL